MSVCAWKVKFNYLLMDENIISIGIPLASKCDCCTKGHSETKDHVFSSSEIAEHVWGLVELALGIPSLQHVSWWTKVNH